MNIFKAISNIYTYFKYRAILNNVYKKEHFIDKLSKQLGINIKKDWFGRLYFVVCPAAQHPNEQIYELIGNKLDNSTYVARWLLTHFLILEQVLGDTNVLDLLIYDIENIDNYNFLVILTNKAQKNILKSIFVLIGWILFFVIIGLLAKHFIVF